MATQKPNLVRGTIGEARVQTTEENAARLGPQFVPESKASVKKAAAKPTEK